jgi:hypothetical protein
MDETSGLMVALQRINTEYGMGIKISMKPQANHCAFIQNQLRPDAAKVTQ